MAWGKNGTPETLTGTDDNIEVTSMGGKKFNVILSHTFASGDMASYMSFNSSTASEYARRQSENGGTDGTGINATDVVLDTGGDANDKFEMHYICGISGEEKLAIGFGINRNTAGAGTAPVRGEYAWKWANTATITTIENDTSAQPGTYAISSNISALGSDLTPSAAIPFPSDVQEGSRAEITDTRKVYSFESSAWVDIGT